MNSENNEAISSKVDITQKYPTEQINELLKGLLMLLNKMKSDRIETWSKKLEGTTKMELHILLLIQQNPEIILREIKGRLDIPNSTLTGVINRMEKHGIIERKISQIDKRSYGLKITEKGMEIRREHDRILVIIASRILAELEEEERKIFIELLSKVAANIN